MRQKGEFQNGYYKKTKHVKFSEKQRFLTPHTHPHVCGVDQGVFLSLNLFNVDIYKGTNSFIYIYICC